MFTSSVLSPAVEFLLRDGNFSHAINAEQGSCSGGAARSVRDPAEESVRPPGLSFPS